MEGVLLYIPHPRLRAFFVLKAVFAPSYNYFSVIFYGVQFEFNHLTVKREGTAPQPATV